MPIGNGGCVWKASPPADFVVPQDWWAQYGLVPRAEPGTDIGLQGQVSLYREDAQPVPIAPSATLAPSPTPTPVVVSIQVSSTAQEGSKFTAPASGNYTITDSSGAYSTWPANTPHDPQWRTVVRIYKNRAITWGDDGYGNTVPIQPDYQVGFLEASPQTSEISAEQSGLGSSTTILLAKGDILILDCVDQQGQYFDNRGSMMLNISY